MGLLSGSEVSLEVEASAFERDGRGGGAVVEEEARREESRRLGQVCLPFLFEDGAGQLVHSTKPDRSSRGRAPDRQGDQSACHDRETGTEIHKGWSTVRIIADELPVCVGAALEAQAAGVAAPAGGDGRALIAD